MKYIRKTSVVEAVQWYPGYAVPPAGGIDQAGVSYTDEGWFFGSIAIQPGMFIVTEDGIDWVYTVEVFNDTFSLLEDQSNGNIPTAPVSAVDPTTDSRMDSNAGDISTAEVDGPADGCFGTEL